MRTASVLSAAAVLAACAQTPPVSAESPAVDCALRVRFGSFASGIDREALDRVRAAFAADARAGAVDERPWGREGERDLCLTPRTRADAQRLADLARAAVPARKLNGYVQVELDGAVVFTTQQPQGR